MVDELNEIVQVVVSLEAAAGGGMLDLVCLWEADFT